VEPAAPITQYRERAGIIDLSWGHPHPDALDTRAWAGATADALVRHGWEALTYGYTAGPGPLLEWLGAHVGRTDARAATTSETFVTAGASHALELVTTLLTRPGDMVVVDSPTYHLAIRTLAGHEVEIVGAPSDEEGIDPDGTAGLIEAARRAGRRVPLLYLVPTYGNPTGRSLPSRRRAALVEAARRVGTRIVEDDTYRELGYGGEAPPSLWSLAPDGPVIRIGSLSKTVAPGVRLGWVNAAPELIRELTGIGYVESGGGVNHTAALTMAAFARSGGYDVHVAGLRRRYARQRDALVDALRTAAPPMPVPSPDGGWFVWLPLPDGVTARSLRTVAEKHGVSFVEGSVFFVRRGGERHVRLSFSLFDEDVLTEAGTRLGRALHRVTGTR
jgi:2-aminoadipate transaminase